MQLLAAWYKKGTRTPGPGPPQSLKVGPGTPLKFKSGIAGPPSKFKSETPGLSLKFKSGVLIKIFLYCFTYFVLDKHIYNMERIFHEIFFVLNSSTIFVKSLMSQLVCLIWWRMERFMQLVWRPTCPIVCEIKQFHFREPKNPTYVFQNDLYWFHLC